MQITSTLSFAAPCDRVADMLVDPHFAEYIGRKADAQNLTVTGIDNGLTCVLTTAAPEKVAKFLGAHMTITWTLTWDSPEADGSRTGRLTINVSGIPASMTGPIRLVPTDTGSSLTLDTDFTVGIPLLGKKIEKMAASHMTSMMSRCEKIGQQWLDTNN